MEDNILLGFKSVNSETSKRESVPNLKSLTKPQLLELLDRQKKIINSQTYLKLPDNGEKVKLFKKCIEQELKNRCEPEFISEALTKLSLSDEKVETIEWGKLDNVAKNHSTKADQLSDNETNPFAILASHSGTNRNQRKIKIEEAEEPLINLSDIKDVFALNLCSKIDNTKQTTRFLPHRTLISSKSSTKDGKIRDLSAATPPTPVYDPAKLITLEESIKIQQEQMQHVKELQLKNATERLKEPNNKMSYTLPTQNINKYRDPHLSTYNDDDSSEEGE